MIYICPRAWLISARVTNVLTVKMPYRSLEDRYLAGRRNAGLPIVTFLAVMVLMLIALLFVAAATLGIGKPVVTSQRSDLPPEARRSHYELDTSAPAPAPDMNSQAVLDAQPKSELDALAKLHPEARAARAEASQQDSRVTQPFRERQQGRAVDRFSIEGQ